MVKSSNRAPFGSAARKAHQRAAFVAAGGFIAVTGAPLSAQVESNIVTMANLSGSPAMTISGGQYSKNGGAYSSSSTTVTNGDTVRLRVNTSGSNSTATAATLTIDGVPRTFVVMTLAASGSIPTLGNLTLVGSLMQGAAASGVSITGVTASSTVTLTGAGAAGLTVNGSGTTRTITGTPSGTGTLGWSEVLAGATNTPNTGTLGTVAAAGAAAVFAPSGFDNANIPPGVNVLRYGSGSASTFGSDWAITGNEPVWDRSLYVDGASGNGDNDALTAGTPVSSISIAVKIAQTLGGKSKILVKPGVYDRTAVTRTAGASGAAGLAGSYFKCWRMASGDNFGGVSIGLVVDGAGQVVSELRYAATAWTDRTGNGGTSTYSGTYTAGSSNVFDFSQTDANGDPMGFAWVPTAADPANPWPEINAAWALYSPFKMGVVFYNGTTIYARTFDNRAPDANIHVMDGASRSAGNVNAPSGDITYYLDGGASGRITFMGGGNAFAVRSNSTYKVNTYARNIHFLGGHVASSGYDNPGNAFAHSSGGGDIIMRGCVASYAALDGFNYHGVAGTVALNPHIIEIANAGLWCGWDGGTANNGSTAHDSVRIVRIGCTYRYNQDRTIHDVNSSMSWNLGVTARARRGQDASVQSAAFVCGSAGQSVGMWIDACVVEGNPQYPLEVYDGSTLRYANLAFVPNANPAGATGTFASYAP